MFLLQFHAFTCHICLLHHVYILLQSSYPDVIVLLLLKLLFCCNFGRRVCRDRLSELSDSNCILLSIMSTFIPCIAMSCFCTFAYRITLFIQHVCVTCFAYIFLAVTPFGVFVICNLISFSCTLCLCYCLLLLTNLKYGLGQNSTKFFNCRVALSVCHV